ncbi:MAG: hypothetical protein Q4C42_01425, partial [Clostridia bacterium]|nr:hypothetical protein [Clostridia bacterium]
LLVALSLMDESRELKSTTVKKTDSAEDIKEYTDRIEAQNKEIAALKLALENEELKNIELEIKLSEIPAVSETEVSEDVDVKSILEENEKLRLENGDLRTSLIESVRENNKEEIERLNREIEALRSQLENAKPDMYEVDELYNPMRPVIDFDGMVDFYEKY